jgi:hypothetical protein
MPRPRRGELEAQPERLGVDRLAPVAERAERRIDRERHLLAGDGQMLNLDGAEQERRGAGIREANLLVEPGWLDGSVL